MSLFLRNGRLLDPANHQDCITSLRIADGIVRDNTPTLVPQPDDLVIDASDLWILPGLVDLCCRPHIKEDSLAQELEAAVRSGFTSLCLPPDGIPCLDTATAIQALLGHSRGPRLFPIGALTQACLGHTLSDLTYLKAQGCIAFSHPHAPLADLSLLRHYYAYAASCDLLVIIQPQELSFAKGVIHEGEMAARLGLPSIPTVAETLAIAQHLLLIADTQVRAHFTCVSSRAGVAQIRQAKTEGLRISADTPLHALHLCDLSMPPFDPLYHVSPPLRSQSDQQALLEGLKDRTLDAICSHHIPLARHDKCAPFAETRPGMSTFDTFLSLGLQLVMQGKLPLLDWVAAISYHPAKHCPLPVGHLSKGAPADVCLFDPRPTWTVQEETLSSAGKNTPFLGHTLQGQVRMTIVGGVIAYAR